MITLYVTGESLVFRYMALETGHSIPARNGDEYIEEIRSICGELLHKRSGHLEITNPETGKGQFIMESKSRATKPRIQCWFWTFYSEELD